MSKSHSSKDWAKTLRVLLVSTSYPADATDWRGVFMRHLVAALARRNDLKLSIWAPPGEIPDGAAPMTTPQEAAWLKQLMAAGGISHLMRSGGARTLPAPVKLLRMIAAAYRRCNDVDVYHINWLQCALPLPRNGKPALITVLGNDLKLMRIPFMRHLLRRVMRGRNVAICPNGKWMQAPLFAAFGDVAKIIPISFGIDPKWYAVQRSPAPTIPARWLVVTRLTADKLGTLFEWSKDFFDPIKRELHLFGPMQEDVVVPQWVHYHGAATPEQLASDWFPHAHGLITLSRHAEGLPQVMLEAMAATLPIVASRMPAHANVVDDAATGLLCDCVESYQAAITRLEEPATTLHFGEAARNWALTEVGTWDDCARRYTEIYKALLVEDGSE